MSAMPEISKSLTRSYLSLTDESEKADLAYDPDLSLDSNEQYLQKLADERPRDRIMGSTRKGPHRDDFLFRLQNRDARTYASEGQQRGLVLALRLAEFSYLREAFGRIPLLLADDVLGELDHLRKANFRSFYPRRLGFSRPVRLTPRRMNQRSGRPFRWRKAPSLWLKWKR